MPAPAGRRRVSSQAAKPAQRMHKKVGPRLPAGAHKTFDVGGDLLSHTLTSAVPSALEGLASGFGMGPGVSPPPQPPTTLSNYLCQTLPNIVDARIAPRPHKCLCVQGRTVDANNSS